jgi:outer membrane protein OmpA-like peptidoglycan-associated protein
MRKSLAAAVIALSVAVVPACATKGFVREEVGGVNTKVDTLSGTVEQTQERVGKNEERIGSVDQKAEAAGKAAAEARSAAGEARTAADAAAANAKAVGGRVEAVAADVAATRKLIYEVTISEDQGNFKFGGADLPDEAKARLDQMIGQLKANPQNVFIEIEGHTDNVGSDNLNERLGMERAEAVKRYLYEQHQVPLHKINVISYGEDKPVAPNNNRE